MSQVAKGEQVSRFIHDNMAGFARFSPDGRWVVSTSSDKTARLWDWQTGKERTEPLRHEGRVVWVDVSSDSQRVLTLSTDKTARIWEARSGKLLQTLSHGGDAYHWHSAEFSADGRLVVIASGSQAQIWTAETGRPVTAPLAHAGRVNSVRFSPDGLRLVTTCHDGTARLWDTATGHPLGEPMRHHDRVSYAEFSPDGRRVITASDDDTARIFEVPMLPASVPPWLAEWAEAVAGQRLDERNASQPVPFAELSRVRQSLAQAPKEEETIRWAKWFFAGNATRRISPGATLTVPKFVEQRVQDDTLESLQQALWLSPNHGLAQARMAFQTLTNTAVPTSQLLASLEFQSRRSLRHSPKVPEVWQVRAKFLDHLGKTAEAAEAMEQSVQLNPTNAMFWNENGLMLEKANRLEEALKSYTRAIELSAPSKDLLTLPAQAYQNRRNVNLRLNRLTEAAADNLKYRNIPARDPATPATLIDLSLYYNGGTDMAVTVGSPHNFTLLPLGRQTLAGGTEFDIRGTIRPFLTATEIHIGIGQKCRKLHFLHVGSGQMNEDGKEVGIYRLHYSDGQRREIPILYGVHVRTLTDLVDPNDPKKALAGNTRVTRFEPSGQKPWQLFEMTWTNDRPEVAIASLDFISRKTGTSPSLFAITVEP